MLWPLSRAGGIWEDLLTDSDGQHTELQSGRVFNQPEGKTYLTPFRHPTFAPGATDLFTERWGVLHAIPDESKQTDFAAARPHEMPSGIWIDCHRALAEKALSAGDRAQAEKLVAEGLSYPENLGRGKPFSTDADVKTWSAGLKASRR